MESLTFLNSLHQWNDWGFLALRIALGAVFLYHGIMKWQMWKMKPGGQMSPGVLGMMKLLSVVEPLGGLAVLTGFLTQIAVVGLGIIMIGAIVMKKKMWKVPFTSQTTTGWEFDLINLAACIALFFSGAGAYSLDQWLLNL